MNDKPVSDKKPQAMKSALKAYYADKSLSTAQLDNLQSILQQKTEQKVSRRFVKQPAVLAWLGTLAASLFLAVLLLSSWQTPALITSAYADIYKDANLKNGMQVSMQQWLAINGIAAVPIQFPVKMSKFCRLDQKLTMHLRIAGKEQGEMNVFFHRGEASLYWSDRSGRVDDMNWKLLKVADDLTLVVLYTQDMREKSVDFILDEMLAGLEA